MKLRVTLAVIAAFLAANGAYMLATPAVWYYSIDSVPLTGPLNVHFVRDIGCAYLAASIGVMCAALRRDWLLPGGLAALGFIGGHALVHAAEALAGQAQGLSAVDLLGIYAPPAVLLAVVLKGWPDQPGREA